MAITEAAWSTSPKRPTYTFVCTEPEFLQPSASAAGPGSQYAIDDEQTEQMSQPDRLVSNPGFVRMLTPWVGARHLHVWLDVLHVEPGPKLELFVQSEFDVPHSTHALLEQIGVPGQLFWQVVVLVHWTQVLVLVLQFGVLPEQLPSPVHWTHTLLEQTCLPSVRLAQSLFPAHSTHALLEQTLEPEHPVFGGRHTTQALVLVLQTGELPEQLLLSMH